MGTRIRRILAVMAMLALARPWAGAGAASPFPDGNAASGGSGAAQRDPVGGAKRTIGDDLAQRPKLIAKLQPLLPEGTNIQEAVKGFRKLDDFAAALHASKNLNIAFGLIKAKMIAGESLLKAIHNLDPTVDSKSEAKKAEDEAKQDMKG